jgi:hypothetical protein
MDSSSIAAAVSEVDQRLRRCVQEIWVLLPPDRQSPDELTSQVKRMVDRALEDFIDDYRAFPGTPGGGG